MKTDEPGPRHDLSLQFRARIDELTESIILKYSASKVFAPFSMTAKQALGFIEDMAKERAEHLAHEAAILFKVPQSPAHA